MCIRCGTGSIAWCTHPTHHGEDNPARTVHGIATTHTFDPAPDCLGPNCWHDNMTSYTTDASPEQIDLSVRWRVTLDAHSAALRALLDPDLPPGTMAMIPLVQPGKQHGWWETGQPVETVPGVIILATEGGHDDSAKTVPGKVLDYSAARTLADKIAETYLAGRDGTFGHAVVEANGSTFVHEGI
jgi:hypothetical protein